MYKAWKLECVFESSTGPLRWTRTPGTDYGLRVTINLDYLNYVGLLASGYGAQIVVHDQGIVPVPEEEGITVKPGQYVNRSSHGQSLSSQSPCCPSVSAVSLAV